MPPFQIVSRAALARCLPGVAGGVVRLAAFHYAGPIRYAGAVVDGLVAAGLLAWVIPVMRTCLIVSDEGLVDRRALRSVRVPWPQIAELRVARPGGPWGGFCVVAGCRDGSDVDLLSTRGVLACPFLPSPR